MEFTCDVNEKFVWDSFLERRKVEPVPNFAFQHVEKSEQSPVEEGTYVEVQHVFGSQAKYWFAIVNMKCGPFLRLKYVGQDDNSKEFWADPSSVEVRPVGYCLAHNILLEPPQDFRQNIEPQEVIQTVLEKHQATDCNVSLLSLSQQMKPGLELEVEDLIESKTAWIATVIRNVGGRLLLRYLLPNHITLPAQDTEMWVFCLSPRLHSIGWVSKQKALWTYKPPKKLRSLCDDEWSELIPRFQNETCTKVPLTFPRDLKPHSFQVDTRVSVLDLSNPTSLKTAIVFEVVDDQRFTVRFDSPCERETLCCFAGDECVRSVEYHNDQPEMKAAESVRPNDLGFDCNMVLEVVNPWKPHDICVGTIVAIENNLLKIHLEMLQEDTAPLPDILLPCSSFDLFPVGWCESHGYPLHGPPSGSSPMELAEQSQSEVIPVERPETETEIPTAGVSYWCPKIYFNFRCFSGPLLSKLRIAALPRGVGPGPILLVLKEVLSLLINGAYKPGSVLKQLQGEPGAPLPKGTQLEPLKAKYKQTTYRGSIPIASTAADVSDYCKWVCEKLQCCTYLFGPDLVGDPCPRRCSVTMVKVHWQHKKRAAKFNGRNKKLVEALKNLPTESTPSSAPEEGPTANLAIKTGTTDTVVENSDDSNEPSESTAATDAFANENLVASRGNNDDQSGDANLKVLRRSILDTTSGHCRTKFESDKVEESIKKKRGRPRKNAKIPAFQADASQLDTTLEECKVEEESYLLPFSHLPPFIPLTSQVSRWTIEEVVGFLVQCGIAKGHLDRFFDEEIDGEAFLCLSPGDLMELLQMRLGPVIKAQNALSLLREKL